MSQYTDAAKQLSTLAENLQSCEDIEKRNEIEDELRALEMVLAYRKGLVTPDDQRTSQRAAA